MKPKSELFKKLNKIRNALETIVEPSMFSAEGKEEILRESLAQLETVLHEINS